MREIRIIPELALVAALGVQIGMPLWRHLFVVHGIIDLPDGVRKLHRGAIPRAGGTAVMSAYVLSLMVLLMVEPSLRERLLQAAGPWMSVVSALLMIFAMGLVDDVFGLRPRYKLAVQVLAAAVAAVPTIVLTGPQPSLGFQCAKVGVAVFWLVLTTNAFNLIDGMDGLASGLALIAAIAFGTAAMLQGSILILLVLVPLAAALASYLRFNFHPASVFLGDSGSYSVGFLLGWSSLACSSKQVDTTAWALASIMICALPVLDVFLAIWRRFLRARPLFAPDHGHLHHRLLAKGLGPCSSALILYVIATVYAVCAVMVVALPTLRIAAVSTAAVITLVMAGVLSHEEVAALGSTLRHPVLRNALATELAIRSAEASIRVARGREERWAALQAASREMGFCSVQMEGPWGALEARTHPKPVGSACMETRCESCRRACATRVRLKDDIVILLYQRIEQSPRANALALAATLQRGWSAQPVFPAMTVSRSARQAAHMQ